MTLNYGLLALHPLQQFHAKSASLRHHNVAHAFHPAAVVRFENASVAQPQTQRNLIELVPHGVQEGSQGLELDALTGNAGKLKLTSLKDSRFNHVSNNSTGVGQHQTPPSTEHPGLWAKKKTLPRPA